MRRFLILGPLEAFVDGHGVEIGGAKQRALLARLLIQSRAVVSSEQLVEDLWRGEPPPSATKLVQGYVSGLRRTLGPEAIRTTQAGYAVGAVETDAAEFERLVHGAQEKSRSPQQAARALRDAQALWRGRPYADVAYEPWAQAEIGRLEELRLVAVEELLALRLQLGEAAELVPELEVLVREHPLRERCWSELMLALYRSGRQAEALERYRQARRRLVEELGIEPTRGLRELEQAILRQDPALDLVEPSAAAGQTMPGFVGREQELGDLLGGLDDAFAGQGRLFLIQGEPGIGKSRLAGELIGHARRRGAQVLVGRCWEAGGAPAFWPWVQSLRALVRDADVAALVGQLGPGAADLAQLLPELRDRFPDLPAAGAVESDAARFRLFDAVSLFVRSAAEARPIVLFLDDLHAADEPSLVLLRFLARELADSRLFVVAAYRDVDPAMRDPLVATLAELAREPCTSRLSLSGLPSAEVARYIQLISAEWPSEDLLAAVSAETEGNPFFIGEIVRLLVAEGRIHDAEAARTILPQSVREVIARRLRHLSPDCNDLLSMASVLGREFEMDELAQLARRSQERLLALLEEAIAERVLSEAPGPGGRMTFAHALIRDALYHDLSAARRAVVHQRAGEALEAVHTGDLETRLSELAHHFLASLPAGNAAKAIEYAGRAGDRAARVLAFEEAVRLYRIALDLVRDDDARASLLERLARVVQLQGRLQEARAALEDAVALYRQLGRTVDAGRVLTALSNVLWRVGDPGKGAVLAQALSLLEPQPPSPELVGAYSELAGQRALEAAHEEAIAAGNRALDLARAIGLPEPVRALGYRGQARACLGEREGLDDMRRALQLAAEHGQEREAAVLYNNLAAAVWLYEGAKAALAACHQGIDFCRQRGIAEWADYISSTSLTFLAWCGRGNEALAEATRLALSAQETGDLPVLIEARTIQLHLSAECDLGEHPPVPAIELAASARESGEPYLIGIGLAAAAELLVAQGKPHDATALLVEVEQLPHIRDDPRYVALLANTVRCALASGDRKLAHQLTTGVQPRTPLFEHALVAATALLAEAAGEYENAAALYADAGARWQQFGNAPERAHALHGHGRCLLASRRADAAPPLLEARELFTSMSYKPALAAIETLLPGHNPS